MGTTIVDTCRGPPCNLPSLSRLSLSPVGQPLSLFVDCLLMYKGPKNWKVNFFGSSKLKVFFQMFKVLKVEILEYLNYECWPNIFLIPYYNFWKCQKNFHFFAKNDLLGILLILYIHTQYTWTWRREIPNQWFADLRIDFFLQIF